MQLDIAQLRQQGYLHLQDFLSEPEHLALLAGCEQLTAMEHLREVPKVADFSARHGSNTHTYLNKFVEVNALDAFKHSLKISQVSQAIFGEDALLHMDLLQQSVGGEQQGIAWHRDVVWRFGAMQMMNLLFYPLGTSAAQGGVRILPKSQLQASHATLSSSFGQVDGEITLYPGPLDLVILDGACFHAVSHSHSSQARLSLNVRIRHPQAAIEVTRYAEFVTGEVDWLPHKKPSAEHAP